MTFAHKTLLHAIRYLYDTPELRPELEATVLVLEQAFVSLWENTR